MFCFIYDACFVFGFLLTFTCLTCAFRIALLSLFSASSSSSIGCCCYYCRGLIVIVVNSLLLLFYFNIIFWVFQQNCNKANFSSRCILLSATQTTHTHTHSHSHTHSVTKTTYTAKKKIAVYCSRRDGSCSWILKQFLYTQFCSICVNWFLTFG